MCSSVEALKKSFSSSFPRTSKVYRWLKEKRIISKSTVTAFFLPIVLFDLYVVGHTAYWSKKEKDLEEINHKAKIEWRENRIKNQITFF